MKTLLHTIRSASTTLTVVIAPVAVALVAAAPRIRI